MQLVIDCRSQQIKTGLFEGHLLTQAYFFQKVYQLSSFLQNHQIGRALICGGNKELSMMLSCFAGSEGPFSFTLGHILDKAEPKYGAGKQLKRAILISWQVLQFSQEQIDIYYGLLSIVERTVAELRLTAEPPSNVMVTTTGGWTFSESFAHDLENLTDCIDPHLSLKECSQKIATITTPRF